VVKYFTPLLIFSQLIMPISLWIYLRKITQVNEHKSHFKHYIFPIIASSIILIVMAIVLFTSNNGLKDLLSALLISYVMLIMTVGFLILNAIYLTFSFVLLYRHQKLVRNYYSYTQKVDLKWIKLMLYAYIFLLFGLILSNASNLEWTDWVFYGVLIVFIVFIGHNAMKQREVWTEEKVNMQEEDINLVEEHKQEELSADQFTPSQLELFQQIKEKLIHVMEEEKPYLDQDLTILKLSKDLNTNTKYLSYVINHEFNQNFINFINDFRIEEVKRNLLVENQYLTIEALGQNAGFKSKSSFNAAFKKSTGMTPSNYMKLKQK
jgi:AraC-like DNA-binding protein